jgi:hypothetical protein
MEKFRREKLMQIYSLDPTVLPATGKRNGSLRKWRC